MGPQLRPAPQGEPGLDNFPNPGLWIFHIAENQSLLFAGLHAGGNKTLSQPFDAEVAFLHDPFGAGGKLRLDFLDKRPRVPEVHGPGPIRTSGHAEPAPDAAMIIHHHDPVFLAFKRGLGRAYADAGRVVAADRVTRCMAATSPWQVVHARPARMCIMCGK